MPVKKTSTTSKSTIKTTCNASGTKSKGNTSTKSSIKPKSSTNTKCTINAKSNTNTKNTTNTKCTTNTKSTISTKNTTDTKNTTSAKPDIKLTQNKSSKQKTKNNDPLDLSHSIQEVILIECHQNQNKKEDGILEKIGEKVGDFFSNFGMTIDSDNPL